jgi:glycosyltransferase involved in cell wall biosynthesis
MPKVSVVIPAYNAMPYLPEAIETVLAQTFTDFEVVVVDDGSTDNTAAWLTQLSDSRVQVISQKNQGQATARNTGITHATGDYIAFLDADDLWKSTLLEQLVNCLESHPQAGLAYCWTALTNQQGHPTGRLAISHAEGNVWKQLIESDFLSCGSVLIRRACFEVVGLFSPDIALSEDWDMWIRIAAKFPFALVKQPLFLYRQHPASSSQKIKLLLQASLKVIDRAFASAPPELLSLKNRSYAFIHLYVGWKALEKMDYQHADALCQKAYAYYPRLLFSPRCIRLRIAIEIVQWFGSQNYSRLKNWLYTVRRHYSKFHLREWGDGGEVPTQVTTPPAPRTAPE